MTAYVYKADAKARQVQSPNLIPADSDAGKAAKRVEIPGVASSETSSNSVGRSFETQSSTGQRYTMKLANGNSIQEVSHDRRAEEVAKRAADKGAKYYHVTRQWQNQSGGNLTVTADLFK